MSLWTALTRNHAATAPDAPDARLRTPVFAQPFATVWQAALALAAARPGWAVTAADPRAGEIRAEARTRVWRFVDDVHVRLWLDDAGLTRVDVESRSRVGRGDFGVNGRRVRRYLKLLAERLAHAA